MADPKATYGIAAGTDYFLCMKAPTGLYDSLATQLGLTKLTTPAQLSKAVYVPAAQFLGRLRVNYQHTSGPRSGGIWCAWEKFEEAKNGLTGTFRTHAIISVGQPLDSNRH